MLGRDRLTDSALLELVERPARKLPAARFGDSSRMAPGDWVMAIGAPFGLSHTVTVGVVSALARSMRPVSGRTNEMLQTDAAIKPGQLRWPAAEHPRRGHRHEHGHHQRPRIELGRRLRRADQHGAGPLLGDLRGGKVTRGVIGVQIGEVPSDDYQVLGLDALRGVIVSTVAPDGPADEAGIEPGDVIAAYAGEPVEDSLDLQRRVVGTRPGTGVAVDVVRNGEPVTLDVTIGELNLDAESRSVMAAVAEETSEGFGITLQDLTSQMMRRLGVPDDTVGAVVADVASGSTAEAGGLQSGDVILRVNRAEVALAAETDAVLDTIEARRTAFLLVQRRDTRVFLQLQKDQ